MGLLCLALWKRSGNERSQGRAAVSSLESQRKGGLGDRVGVSPGLAACCCSLLPWLQVSWGPLAFSRKKIYLKRRIKWSCSKEVVQTSLSNGVLPTFQRWQV